MVGLVGGGSARCAPRKTGDAENVQWFSVYTSHKQVVGNCLVTGFVGFILALYRWVYRYSIARLYYLGGH